MAKPRKKLSELLHTFCKNVYYQPPTGTKITYPCIIYDLDRPDVTFADNVPYALYDQYSLKYITRDPDDQVRYQIIMIPLCSADKPYIADNLYHHPFRLYW
jgi:hypothetical protein